jgi:hypothetical protein
MTINVGGRFEGPGRGGQKQPAGEPYQPQPLQPPTTAITPPQGPQMPPGMPPQGPPGAEMPPQGPQGPQTPPPATSKQPGNEGLVGRIIGLLNGEDKKKQQQAFQQAIQMGVQSAAKAPQMSAPQDQTAHIYQLLAMLNQAQQGKRSTGGSYVTPTAGAGMAQQRPAMSHGGPLRLMRGGYPFDYLQGSNGLPVRRDYAQGSYVEGDGRGDGRSDHVEALLSPKEFVVDAETMAMLGNGDPDAGAERMEEFREGIRQHKGRALAQGKFSPDAKSPGEYMDEDPYPSRRRRA